MKKEVSNPAKKVILTLIQNETQIAFEVSVQSEKISEISGTIANNVIALYNKKMKYKNCLDLNGFTFARKFDLKLSVDSVEAGSNAVLGNSTIKFGLTITQGKVNNFVNFVQDLTTEILTGSSQLVVDYSELLQAN